MPALSYRMREDLRALARPDHHIHRRGITNPTLNALRTRGLASVTYSRETGEFWDLTEAGREALKPRKD